MKDVYDIRGRQTSILRLARFDGEALVHMLFYRALIFAAPMAALFIAASLFSQNQAVILASRLLVLLVWILFTPQLFSALKAFSLVSSGGAAFGRFSEAFARTHRESLGSAAVYKVIPYAGMAVWITAFLALAFMWFL